MPLEVSPHPKEPPGVRGSHERYLRKGDMVNYSFVSPIGTNLEEFKGVTSNVVTKIHFMPYCWVGSTSGHELAYRLSNSFELKFAERHGVCFLV